MNTQNAIVAAERIAEPTPVPKFPGGFITIWPSQRHGNDWIWPSMSNFIGNGFDESERFDMATRTANDKPGAFVVRIPADGEKIVPRMPECVWTLVESARKAKDVPVCDVQAVVAYYAGGGQ